jgi:dipeptidyl aminopeptidase/acylaminoacyl peptidase
MASDRLTPDELVYGLRAAASPVIAPDGSLIAFSLTSTDRDSGTPRAHLWTMCPDGSDLRQLTTIGNTNSGPAWSPDSQSIAFVSHGDSEEKHSIRVIRPGGGESRILAQHDLPPAGLAWSPDGTTIAYSVPVDFAPKPDEDKPEQPPPPRVVRSLQYKEDLRGVQNRIRSQIFVVDVEGGEPRQLTEVERDHADPQWSPDGSKLAIKVVESTIFHQRLGVVEIEAATTSISGEDDWSVGTFRWLPDGNTILFDGGPDGLIQSEWFLFDLATGTYRQLTNDLRFLPEGGFTGFMPPAQPIWLDDGTALVHGIQAGGSGLWSVNPADGGISELARFDSIQSGLSVDCSCRYAVQSYSDPARTGEVSVVDLETRALTVITDLNEELFARAKPGDTERITTKSLGESIDAWVTYPPDFDPNARYPVVLEVHGGPYGYFGHSFNRDAQAIAAAGMIVVSSNPRGSTSYGRRFAQLVNEDSGGGDWADVQAALDAVLEHPHADQDRTAIYGYSYGGYMTSWAIGKTNRFKAAVCGAPVFDLESFYGSSDIAHMLSPMLWGGTPADKMEWLLERSPSTHVYGAVTPTLIVCGESDVRCPISQSEQMFAALKTGGVDVEFVRYPNSNHMFPFMGPPSYRVDYLTRVRDWLACHLGVDSPAGSGVTEKGQA